MNTQLVTYLFTVIAVGMAAVIRWLLVPFLGNEAPFATFIIAVICVARFQKSFAQSVLATILGFIAVLLWFTPHSVFTMDSSVTTVSRFGLYFLICGAIATFGESARRGQASALLAKEAADRQADFLRITLASIGDAIMTTDCEGRITYLNSVAESLTGYRSAEAMGLPLETVFRIVNETSRQPVENPVEIALRTGSIVGLANHTILIAKDGAEHAIDDSASPIRNNGGDVVGCVLIFRDIGQQRHLQRQSRVLASIVHSSEDAIISKSLDGIIHSWNAAAQRLFGYTPEQAIGNPISLIIPPDRLEEEQRFIAQLKAGQRIEHFDTVRLRSDGTPIPVSLTISPIRDESGQVVGASKIARDISDRKLAEEKLRESESRKSAILESAMDCIISINHEGMIMEFNPAAERTFGYRRAEVMGRDLADLIVPSQMREQCRRGINQFQSGNVSKILNSRVQLTAMKANGIEFPIEMAVTQISTSGPPMFTAYLRDITERKRLEQVQADRTRMVSLRADISTELSSAKETSTSLQACCEAMVRHLGVAFARIWTLDETGETLELRASAGLVTQLDGPHSRIPFGEFKIGRIASSRQSHLTNTVSGDQDFHDQEWVASTRMIAFAGHPLVVEDRVLGVIAMFSRHALTENLLTELAPLSDSIAQFLDRMRAEELFRQQAELTRTTLASIGDAVITTNVNGEITQLNTVAQSLTGWTNEQALGQPLETVFRIVNETTRQPVQNPALKALREGVIVGLANHTILIARDNSERPIDDSAAPIRRGDGEVVGCVLVFRDITERKQAELKLAESRSRLETTLVAGEVGTWEYDIIKNVVRADRNLARMFGVTGSEAEGGPLEIFTRAIHPDDRDRVAAEIAATLENGDSFESEYRVIDAEGERRWVVARGQVHRDSDGKPLRLPGVVVDITRQHLIEAELRASEERRRMALNSAELGSWNIDPATSSLICDERFQTIFCGRTEPITYEQAFAIIHDDDREQIRAAVEAATRPGNPAPYSQEYRVIHPDGSVHWVFAKGRANFDGERLTSFDGTVADVTERKRSEERLRESEHRLRFILDSMPQKIFTATAEGNVDYFNPVWTEFTGLSIEQIRDWGWRAFIHFDDVRNSLRVWKNSITTGVAFQVEHRFRCADGHYRWHVSRARALKDDKGQIVMWVGANTDIHEERRTADELREVAAKLSEADHRKDEFLATLAHELRNPLAPLRNGLQVMKLAKLDTDAVEQSRRMMERQLDQMVRLVDDLMDVSRISRGKLDLKMQKVELADVVNSAVETSRPLVEQMSHNLTVTLPTEPVLVDADFTRLAQVFLNLLNNAAKYSDPGGHIQLTTRQQGSDVLILIKDTGIGIAADQLVRIFDIFSQVDRSLEKSQGGLGIGLTLVKRLVELHGGSVEAYSEGLGKGSEFVVRLPVVSGASNVQAANSGDKQSPSKSALRILIVDDNRDSADSLSMMLKFMGNETRTAYDGEEALSLAKSFLPNVILLDIGLPKLNGYEACRRIREQPWGKGILMIAQTGWGQDEDRQRTRDAGFDHHLVKPIEPMELMKILAKHSEEA